MQADTQKLTQSPSGPAVIFDMDGCLVDSEPLCLEAIAAEMRALGVSEATPEMVRNRFLGVGFSEIARFVSQRTKAFFPKDFALHVEATLQDRYVSDLKVIKGVIPLLKRLEILGFQSAIATGASMKRMSFTLDISGLSRFFEGKALCVDDVARGKPAPDLFLLAAKTVGVDPANCIVLEDSPHGIKGAVEAGMTAVGFVGGSHLSDKVASHGKTLREAGATEVFQSIEDFLAFVEHRNSNQFNSIGV